MAAGFDLIGIFLILVMAINGLRKGLIDGILKMVAVYAAIYCSMNYNHYGTQILEPLIAIPDAYKIPVGFVLVFLLVMYSINFLSFLLRKIVTTMHLGAIDRIGGITFGAVKAGLILSAVVWAFAMVPDNLRGDWQRESKLYPLVEIFAANTIELFSLEDELVLLQTTVGSLMGQGQDKIVEQALESAGSLNLKIDTLHGADDRGGLATDSENGTLNVLQSEMLKKAMESLEGSQKEIIEQALKSLKSGNATSLLEGAIKSKDASGKSLMDDAMKSMNPTEKTDLHDLIKQMESELKHQQNNSR